MSLLRFELAKIFSRKSMWVSLLVLLGLLIFVYSGQYESGWDSYNNVEYQKVGREVAHSYQGVISKADIKDAEKVIRDYEEKDFQTYKEEGKTVEAKYRWEINIASEMNMIGSKEIIQEKIEALKAENATLSEAEVEKYNLHIHMLKERSAPYFTYSNGWNGLIDFVNTFGFFMLAILIILGLSPVFSNEDETGVNQYILSSKNGRKKVVTMKITASIIYVLFVTILFYLVALIHHAYLYTLEGGNGSLQLAIKYIASPFNFTLMEYHFIQLAYFIAGALAFAVMVLLISSLARNSMMSFFISGVVFGVPVLLFQVLDLKQEWITNLFAFSYSNLMSVENMFIRFKAFNLFGHAYTYASLAAVWVVLLLGATILLLFGVNKRKQITN